MVFRVASELSRFLEKGRKNKKLILVNMIALQMVSILLWIFLTRCLLVYLDSSSTT